MNSLLSSRQPLVNSLIKGPTLPNLPARNLGPIHSSPSSRQKFPLDSCAATAEPCASLAASLQETKRFVRKKTGFRAQAGDVQNLALV